MDLEVVEIRGDEEAIGWAVYDWDANRVLGTVKNHPGDAGSELDIQLRLAETGAADRAVHSKDHLCVLVSLPVHTDEELAEQLAQCAADAVPYAVSACSVEYAGDDRFIRPVWGKEHYPKQPSS